MNIRQKIVLLKIMTAPKMGLYELLINKEKNRSTQKFEIDEIDGGREVAPIKGQYAGGILLNRRPFSTSNFEPERINIRIVQSTSDVFKEQPGMNIYSVEGKNDLTKIQNDLEKEDMKRLKTISKRTRLYMLAKLLQDGILPQIAGGTGIQYDETFSKVVLSGDDLFSSPNADIIGWLTEKKLEIQEKCGANADIIIVTPDVAAAILKNEKIIEQQMATSTSIVDVKPKADDIKGITYLCYIPLLGIEIYSYQEFVSLYDETTKEFKQAEKLLEDGTLIMTSKKSFNIDYGAFPYRENSSKKRVPFVGAEALSLIYGLESDDPDLLNLISAPLIYPLFTKGVISAKVL